MRTSASPVRALAIALATLASLGAGLAACSPKADDTAADTPVAGAAAAPAESDPDRVSAGAAGLPAGYMGRTDRATQQLTDVKYAEAAGALEITTGPAHIMWKAADTASGAFTARATFEQLAAPQHAEAYGIILGGTALEQPAQRYTYVLLRGDGRWMVKAREGDVARTVVDWTESAAVPKQDATSGRTRHELAVQVTGDSLRVMVNGKPVGSAPKAGLPTDGIVGLRVNHNLHVRVTPVTVAKG